MKLSQLSTSYHLSLKRGAGLALGLLLILSCVETRKANHSVPPGNFRISFGSCNHQWDEQPMWSVVESTQPDLWVWLGDIIYADTEKMSEMATMYAEQSENPEYQRFAENIPIIGVWDDHDYGSNNSGREYPKKDSSKTLLFEFLNLAKDHPAYQRTGAYQSHTFEANGHEIKIILLDVRYFRDQPGEGGATILGKDQWDWLVKELSESEALVHIIGGGIQFFPEDHRYEKWANFPLERERLITLVDSLAVPNPIFLSGDRHFAEVMQLKTPGGKTLTEVTSSGLTHSYDELTQETNRYRIGTFYSGLNFGLLSFDWKKMIVTAEVKDRKNQTRISVEIPIDM